MSIRPKAILFRLALALSGLVAGLYASELAFRELLLARAVPRTDREFQRVVASNWPRPVAAAKEPETFRILGLADSFGLAGGTGNYHFLLEDALARTGLRVEVVNLSVAAYAPHEELELLRRFGDRYRPDLVVHGFFVGNDFVPPGPAALSYRGIVINEVPGLASWYPHNLTSLQWLAQWRHVLADRRRQRAEGQREAQASFSRESFLRVERVRLSTCRRPARPGVYWPQTTRLLDQIAEEAQRLGAGYVLVVHPDQFQVEPALAAEIMAAFGLQAQDYDLDLPQKYLAAYAMSRGRSIVDLTPAFRRRGAAGGLYVPLDTHYNEAGNRVAAEVILEALAPLLARRGADPLQGRARLREPGD